jgi:hypothetical protein
MTRPPDPVSQPSTNAMPSGRTINRLIGVYNADGSLVGELRYWIGARVGRAQCALCDITHGLLRERSEWRSCVEALPIPFITFHRDDQPDAVRRLTGDDLPVVVAEFDDDSYQILLTADALEGCRGSVDSFEALLEAAIERSKTP